jgi:hypothetical protein
MTRAPRCPAVLAEWVGRDRPPRRDDPSADCGSGVCIIDAQRVLIDSAAIEPNYSKARRRQLALPAETLIIFAAGQPVHHPETPLSRTVQLPVRSAASASSITARVRRQNPSTPTWRISKATPPITGAPNRSKRRGHVRSSSYCDNRGSSD